MTKAEREEKLRRRLEEMQVFERKYRARGMRFICGVDEVGRGPLAGPVVAAAVILPEDFSVLGVDDSKKLSEKRREALFEEIAAAAVDISLGMVDNQVIDEINILEATKRAMRMALDGLRQRPDCVLIDALTLPDLGIPQAGIIKGDSQSVSIAAASIVAKVTRDRLMREYHERFPWYGFDSNKGYGTAAHYAGLAAHGSCPIHRKSFLHEI